MARLKRQKPYWEMSLPELQRLTREFDEPFAYERGRSLTKAQKAKFRNATSSWRKKMRPKRLSKLPEFKLVLKRVKAGDRRPKGYPDNLGIRTQLGGKPEWIQGDATPHCRGCGAEMTFVAQIDSVEHLSRRNPHSREFGQQKWMFGDVGMIYVFYCFKCHQPHCLMQDY